MVSTATAKFVCELFNSQYKCNTIDKREKLQLKRQDKIFTMFGKTTNHSFTFFMGCNLFFKESVCVEYVNLGLTGMKSGSHARLDLRSS